MRSRTSRTRIPQHPTPDASAEDRLLQRWREARSPDERETAATELLVGRRRAIFVWCHKQEADADLAQDLTQEILMKALVAMRAPQTQIDHFGAWLFTLTRNHCANHIRSISRRPSASSPVDIESLAMDAISPQKSLELEEERRLVARWMQAHLTSTERTALWMRVVDELSLSQIAELLDLDDPERVRVLLQRARRKLLRGAQADLDAMHDGEGEVRA